ncbi:MAG TPA: hypothetical protein VF705_04240 [Longimicrobium sp.]|jgi:hypothetical protein
MRLVDPAELDAADGFGGEGAEDGHLIFPELALFQADHAQVAEYVAARNGDDDRIVRGG